ncbi:23S rRNA (guanosine-2'-O-) -methyltransferase rlmB [Methylophaga frappieri]|uniref:23S rRNA (guanosine-2'-O-)-methyltransferase RlmB n=1 Tax=Methylophaga frappieri (strain ATCC BAA-2434 / DSM 25690 / JAM7) TaxID=754477 RepID=I1YGL8_METFJ|nr:23S rRNA (guanosine-2'-O-) -methyltransferase rlmB [Methylophaga frappieri]
MYGFHAVQAALEAPVTRVSEIWLADERHDPRVEAILTIAASHSVPVQRVSRKALEQLVPDLQHQGCVARVKPLETLSETQLMALLADLTEAPFLLILDGVQDPHNLGACLRTAEAAGVHAVIAPKDRAATLTPTAIKISSGAAERVPFVQVTNLARVLKDLQQHGIWLVGTSGEADKNLYQADLTGPLGIVLGAEGKGIRRLTREHCDDVVLIPMQGQAESLNVSVAAGVCLFEATRQRGL